MTKKDCAIIMCPPFSDYPEAPEDQPDCQLFKCPMCLCKMWVSEKKRGVLNYDSSINKEIFISCYHCFEDMAEKDPEFILNANRVDI
jgi:hypothetical protein